MPVKSIFPALSLNAVLAVFLGTLLLHSSAQANPDIQTWTTDNGARVYFVPAPELPMVDMRVVFDAGAARDGKLPGLAKLTNGMLAEGAAGMDANEIATRFESIGARFGNSTQRDMTVFSLRTLSEEKIFTDAVHLFSQILAQPDFPTDALERERRLLLASLQRQKQRPGTLANKAFYEAVFGDHPYHSQTSGTEEGVNAIDAQALRDFYGRYYVARNAVFAIVGNLDRNGAEQLAEQIVGKLLPGSTAEDMPPVEQLAAGEEIRIQHPSAQTHILMGQPGMRRGDPDYFALYVGNHMLGGSGLIARLSSEIREKRGLAYSTYSYFAPMRKNGPYTIGVQTKNESAEETLQILRSTVRSFIAEGPSPEELEASKKNITGGFPLRVSSNNKILDYIAMIGFYQLPLDYLQTFNDHVQAVSIEDIKDAFQRRIHVDKMVTVMVGGVQTTNNN